MSQSTNNVNSHRLTIGQYNIISTIGTGSFGKVKLAVHAITGQRVALKIINRKKIASMDMGGRVKREIQYLKLLRHPHIIKLYEVITTPTDIIMVIEYASKELFNYIVEKGRMNEDDARRFFQQIICAVEYCHRHKIVHRDLKPENLLLDANNNVKIADFGLSNIMTDGDFLKTSCGSPNYAAPEVISGKLYAGPEVDVWSCGVILYVMLCGRLPFDDEYIPTLFKKINGGIYTMPSYLSPETKSLLSSMLVVDPLKRITIQEIRKNAWFNKNLPAYLRPLPSTEESDNLLIDDNIVFELSKKMGYSTLVIQKALKEPDNNQFKVAYQLVLDHKRLLQDSENNHIQSFFATSPPPWNTFLDENFLKKPLKSKPTQLEEEDDQHMDVESSIAVLSSSLPKSDYIAPQGRDRSIPNPAYGREGGPSVSDHSSPNTSTPSADVMQPNTPHPSGHSRKPSNTVPATAQQHPLTQQSKQHHLRHPINTAMTADSTFPASPTTPTRRPHKSRSRWHFGIRSRCPAWEVMLEIYRSLQNVGMEWRTLDPYHLRCRYRYQDLGLVVKFDLQLYRLENNSYLVDFKNAGTQKIKPRKDTHDKGVLENSETDMLAQQQQSLHPFDMLEGDIGEKMELLRASSLGALDKSIEEESDVQDSTENDGPYLARWPVKVGSTNVEHIQSVYPFLDVCSKLITDIV